MATPKVEEWQFIANSKMYQVSTFGRVKSIKTGCFLKPFAGNSGYYQVGLSGDIGKTIMVHRLVAKTFLPNPENKPQVNHINGDKLDNRLDNLEWNTSKENMRHCYDTGLKTYKPLHYKGKSGDQHNRSKEVFLFSPTGILIARYGSASEAGRVYDVGPSAVTYNCKTKSYSYVAKGFFSYENLSVSQVLDLVKTYGVEKINHKRQKPRPLKPKS